MSRYTMWVLQSRFVMSARNGGSTGLSDAISLQVLFSNFYYGYAGTPANRSALQWRKILPLRNRPCARASPSAVLAAKLSSFVGSSPKVCSGRGHIYMLFPMPLLPEGGGPFS